MAKLMALQNGSRGVSFVRVVALQNVVGTASGVAAIHVKVHVAAVATMVVLAHRLFGKSNTKERRLQ